MGQIEDQFQLPGSSADRVQSLPHDVVGYARDYRDGYVSVRHRHPRHQLIYAVSGLMMAETEAMSYAIPPGYGLIVPAEQPHEIRMIGAVRLQSLYVRAGLPGADALARCRLVTVSPLLAQLIAALCEMDNPWPMPPRALHLSQLILIELLAAPVSPLALPYPVDPRLRRVCDALIATPASPRDLDGWATEAGMSRRTFSRHFQMETGVSFGKWAQRLRCQAALRGLAQGRPAARVARDLGYANAYTMAAMMRRMT